MMSGEFFVRQFLRTPLGGVLAGYGAAWTQGFMLQLFVAKDKDLAPGAAETTRQRDQVYEFVQDDVGRVHKVLLAGLAAGDLVGGLAVAADDMAFAALDDGVAAKLSAHGAR